MFRFRFSPILCLLAVSLSVSFFPPAARTKTWANFTDVRDKILVAALCPWGSDSLCNATTGIYWRATHRETVCVAGLFTRVLKDEEMKIIKVCRGSLLPFPVLLFSVGSVSHYWNVRLNDRWLLRVWQTWNKLDVMQLVAHRILSFDFNKCLQPHQACNKKRVRFGHNAPSSANPAGQLFHISAVQTSDLPAKLLLMLMLIRLCWLLKYWNNKAAHKLVLFGAQV